MALANIHEDTNELLALGNWSQPHCGYVYCRGAPRRPRADSPRADTHRAYTHTNAKRYVDSKCHTNADSRTGAALSTVAD